MIFIPDKKVNYRNLIKIQVTGDSLAWLFTEGTHVYEVSKGLPENAEFISAHLTSKGEIFLVFEHPSFPRTEEWSYMEERNVIIGTGIKVLAEEVDKKFFELKIYNAQKEETDESTSI